MMPPKPERAIVVGDDAHGLVDRVLLAVEADEFLARLAEARAHGALKLVGVVDVQRTAAVLADVVGHVDQRVDGPQADRLETLSAATRATGRC